MSFIKGLAKGFVKSIDVIVDLVYPGEPPPFWRKLVVFLVLVFLVILAALL
jgi:hypothetical protein